MTTADRIRNRRIELKLTQLEVAQRIGLTSKAAMCKIEKQGDDVTLKNVEKIAKALNCTPAYLMGWTDEPEENTISREEEFAELYTQLNDDQKTLVDNMIKVFLQKQ